METSKSLERVHTHTHGYFYKTILKFICFTVIFCFLFYYVSNILWLNKTAVAYFYDEPENSIDVAYIGSSNVYTAFNSTLAFDMYGYTTGMMTTASQPFMDVKYLMQEVLEKQNPKLFVIDLARVGIDNDVYTEEDHRRTLDSMEFSKNRFEAINDFLELQNIPKDEYLDYYFSFFMYHNRWKNITKESFEGEEIFFKGYVCSKYTVPTIFQKKSTWTDEEEKLQESNEKVLNELIDYIKKENLNVLFVVPIKCYNDENVIKRTNYAIRILEENNFKVLNLNKEKDIKINFSTDLYNANHLNVYGATKNTLYFSKYLKENYDLPDHRDDKKYDSWKKEYKRFKKQYKKLTKNNFDDLLKDVKKE